MIFYIYVCFVALLINGIDSGDIDKKVIEYFESVKLLQKDWQSHKTAFENALLVAITETYGYKDMNVYVKKTQHPLSLSSGYLHSDNQVQIMLLNLELEELPHLRMPQLAFDLPSNVLQIDSSISKMIVQANYMVFRNRSDIIYALQDQDPNQNSPFRFQQVKTVGKLAIIIEGCTLTGIFLTILNGQTINLGHNVLGLTKCLYTFEISTPGVGGPPVIVRYNTKGEGLSLEHLLLKPLRNELVPKLQAAMFSYINTSAIFSGDFLQIRQQQRDILKAASSYINNVVQKLNKITAMKNQGIVEMQDLVIEWDDALEGDSNSSVIKLSKMLLTGLDTLYSAHIGGPYKIPGIKIGEEIRFDILQIRGEAYFGNEVTHGSYDFSVEIRDVTVEVTIGINVDEHREDGTDKIALNTSKSMKRFQIVGWRTIDFAIPGIAFMSTESLITGYLLNTLPKYLVKHLQEVYKEATDEEYQKDDQEESVVSDLKEENSKDEEKLNEDQSNGIGNEEKEEDENRQSEENNDNNEQNVPDDEDGFGGSNENNENNDKSADPEAEENQENNESNEENADPDAEENENPDAEENENPDAEENANPDAEENADPDAEENANSDAEENANPDAEENADPDAEENANPDAEDNADPVAEENQGSYAETNAVLQTLVFVILESCFLLVMVISTGLMFFKFFKARTYRSSVYPTENNDNDIEHENDAAEPLEPEESHGNREEEAEKVISDEDRNMLNDTIDGLTESPSDEVDKQPMFRQRLIRNKHKIRSKKTKTVTDNEV